MGKDNLTSLLNEMLRAPATRAHYFYERLDEAGLIAYDYGSYMVTEPIHVDKELTRVKDADWNLCRALLTMLFREDHFSNGSFQRRAEQGDLKLILDRMIDLLHDEPRQLRSIRLVSDGYGYGPKPEPGEEIEQHLTISRTGQVWFSGYHYPEENSVKESLLRKERLSISHSAAADILDALAAVFDRGDVGCFVTDMGTWNLEMRFSDGSKERYGGSMCFEPEISIAGKPLSQFIRDSIPIQDLFLFQRQYE